MFQTWQTKASQAALGLLSAAEWARLVALRHDIHAHPEIAYHEHRTAALIAEWLRAIGLEVHTGIGKTGVVARLKRGESARAIAFRADMDALPLQEAGSAAYASTQPGLMHACGHDGHTVMLLGAASALAKHYEMDGTLYFIFQPAEESGAGARAMIEDGLFERFACEAVYALHNWPSLAAGKFAVRTGTIMGTSFQFKIVVHGRGGHAALPHRCLDPVPAVCAIVTALQTIVSRECDAADAAVISVTQLGASEAKTVIPHEAWLAGTARFASGQTKATVREAVRRVANGIAQGYGMTASVEVVEGYPATVNTAHETQIAAEAMRAVVGDAAVDVDHPINMTTEDFGFMLEQKPGCYGLIGTGDDATAAHDLHHPQYDFNDAVIPLGVHYWTMLAQKALLPRPARFDEGGLP